MSSSRRKRTKRESSSANQTVSPKARTAPNESEANRWLTSAVMKARTRSITGAREEKASERQQHPEDESGQINKTPDARAQQRPMIPHHAQSRERPNLEREKAQPFDNAGGGIEENGEVGGGERAGAEIIRQADIAEQVGEEDGGEENEAQRGPRRAWLCARRCRAWRCAWSG